MRVWGRSAQQPEQILLRHARFRSHGNEAEVGYTLCESWLETSASVWLCLLRYGHLPRKCRDSRARRRDACQGGSAKTRPFTDQSQGLTHCVCPYCARSSRQERKRRRHGLLRQSRAGPIYMRFICIAHLLHAKIRIQTRHCALQVFYYCCCISDSSSASSADQMVVPRCKVAQVSAARPLLRASSQTI